VKLDTECSSDSTFDKSRIRVLIFCQYVRGIGHLVRATELAREFASSFDVCFINGGQPVPAFELPQSIQAHCIAPIFRDEDSGELVPSAEYSTLADCRDARELKLRGLVQDFRPDVVVAEHFPFGLLFEREFISLIESAKKLNLSTKIVSSVRDVVLAPGGGSDDIRTCQILERLFDLVLVHGDASVIEFSDSFPRIDSVATPLQYTGYIVRPFNRIKVNPCSELEQPPIVIASIGGGRVGLELLEVVVDASKLIADKWTHRLKLFIGPFVAADVSTRLRSAVGSASHIDICEFTQKFNQDLRNATVAIGLAGYNTLIESVAAGVPTLAYLLPFRHGDREQELRAVRFRDAGLLETLELWELTPSVVAERILKISDKRSQSLRSISLDGAATSRQLIEGLVLKERSLNMILP
jgi:predicted glycosyltransferase